MAENIRFRVCRCHNINEIHEGAEIETTSSYLEFCSLCGRYTNEIRYVVESECELIYEEPCNCGDWIRHNDGGNYHYSSWRVLKVIEIRRVDDDYHDKSEVEIEDEALLE